MKTLVLLCLVVLLPVTREFNSPDIDTLHIVFSPKTRVGTKHYLHHDVCVMHVLFSLSELHEITVRPVC